MSYGIQTGAPKHTHPNIVLWLAWSDNTGNDGTHRNSDPEFELLKGVLVDGSQSFHQFNGKAKYR